VQTGWSNAMRENQTELAGAMHNDQAVLGGLMGAGASRELATTALTVVVEHQSVMLATLNMFAVIATCFFFAATIIWLAPKPKGPIDTSGAH
jgi:DHA2 family multidrug resistance protein